MLGDLPVLTNMAVKALPIKIASSGLKPQDKLAATPEWKWSPAPVVNLAWDIKASETQ